ncbi:MAG: tyrosine-type recombinase/integrase [Prolixibacteraceae bacterium]|nr:tyrosine-type recombinase/integrase [Prolixibacteraceae bacterium]
MGLWKDKKRKDWCYKFEVQKKTYGSRGYTTKRDATAARAEHRRRVLENTGRTPKSMGFREVASIYLDDAKRRYVTKTYKYKVSVFKAFLDYHGDLPMDKITPVVVDSYLKTRKTNNNYNVHRKDLSALFTYARDHLQVITHNPVSGIDKLPHTAARKIIPSEKDVVKLLEAADPVSERPFLLCLIHLAARIDEVLRLTWDDIDFKNRTVTRWTKKRRSGGYEPIITYMNDDLLESLQILYRHRQREQWVFLNEETGDRFRNRRKMMYGINKRAGIDPPIHYHELRHFIASVLADSKNISKKTISEILGHKSLATTEIYLHSIGDSQVVAMKGLEGRFSNGESQTATDNRHQKAE